MTELTSPALVRALWAIQADPSLTTYEWRAAGELLSLDLAGMGCVLEITHSTYDRETFPFESRFNLRLASYDHSGGETATLWLADIAEPKSVAAFVSHLAANNWHALLS